MRIHPNQIKLTVVLATLFGAGLFLVSYWTAAEVISDQPDLVITEGDKPTVSAASFLVIDILSGSEVASYNANKQLPIASITKLFTAAAFRERTDLVGTTTVTWGDVITEGRAGKLQAGEVYPYNELVQAMLLESSNDAATTIYRTDAGVLNRMNEYPKAHQFSSTTFSDTSGLSGGNLSTAHELALLTRDVWNDQPHLFDVSNMPQMIGTYTGWKNNNPFIGMEGYRGGKHGFTYEANRTAVAVFTETFSPDERDFIYVLLGSDDLRSDIEQLRTYVRDNVRFE